MKNVKPSKTVYPDYTSTETKTPNTSGKYALLVLLLLMCFSCSDDTPTPANPDEPEKTEGVSVDLPADEGEIGVIINAREIFRKGYQAKKANVKFPNNPEFDTTLEIDPITNVAILKIPNEELTEDQKDEFSKGTPIEIKILDENEGELEAYSDDRQQLDDSNSPLTIPTTLNQNLKPILLRKGVPYYMQPEEHNGEGNFEFGQVLNSLYAQDSDRLFDLEYPSGDDTFNFYFEPVDGKPNTYLIQGVRQTSTSTQKYYLTSSTETEGVLVRTQDSGEAYQFELEQDLDGWAKIKELESGNYITIVEGSSKDARKALVVWEGSFTRFRFISSAINWTAIDRGTTYSESIIPAAQIDFAYSATIKNCSEGLLTDEVGVEKERSSTRIMQTTESLQFFAGATFTAGMTTGLSAGASVPGVGDVSASVEISASLALTTNVTTSKGATETAQNTQTTTVSRVRTLEIPPFTGVEVYDAVRLVRGAKVPFTQQFRITAKYDDGTDLTEGEILTQMQFNFVTAIPIAIGKGYVDVGLAGYVTIDEMFETETGIDDIENACE